MNGAPDESRSLKKFLRHKPAMISFVVIMVYVAIAAAVILGDLVSVEDCERRYGPKSTPGFSVNQLPEKELQDITWYAEQIEQKLKLRKKLKRRIESRGEQPRNEDIELELRGLRIGNLRPADISAEEFQLRLDDMWDTVAELDEFEDLNMAGPDAATIEKLINTAAAQMQSLYAEQSATDVRHRKLHLLFGTDVSGRSVFLRSIYSIRVAVLVGVVTGLVSVTFGSLLGLAANLPFTAQVRFSGNTTWGDADDIVLLPDLPIDGDIGSGAASIIGRRVYVPLEAAAATDLFVGVKVDIDNVVAETDEANNVLWSATANVSTIAEPAPASAWRFEFSLANAENEAIQIGMQSSATDGFDLDVDTLTFVPGNPEGFAYFQVSDKSVTHDIRSISNVAPWDLAVIAGAQPVTLSWDPAAIPADQQLVVSAVDDQDEVVLDQITYLTSQSSLQVAAGTAVDFRIDLVPLADDNFVVSAGWNLLSAPLEPVTPDVASVLADAGRTAHLLGGRLWRWSGAQLAASEAMHGATGYWFYALHNETVNIRGVIPFTGRIPLQPGWNLIGVSEQMAVPVIANASAFWRWADNRFHNATVLQPGRGYWVYVEEETVMDVVAP